VTLVSEAIGELKEAIQEMTKEKPKRRLVIKRDKDGNMTEAAEE
jgi:hypothetical protein